MPNEYEDLDEFDDDDVFEYEDDDWDDDYCWECQGYGDDYFINDDGELECACSTCWRNPNRDDWDD